METQNIRKWTEARDLPLADRYNQRFVAEFLPGMNIRQVDLDRGDANRRDGVPESDAGVRVGSRVDDDALELTFRLLNPTNQLPLDIGLAKLDLRSQRRRPLPDSFLDLGQGHLPVFLRLALPEEV